MNVEDSYLRSVERRLRAIAPEHRSAVLDDLRGHFADAGDAGRPVDETIRGLGSAQEIADRAVEEFGADASASYGRAELAWRVLQGTAVATAIGIGALAALISPVYSTQTEGGSIGGAPRTTTLIEMNGVWVLLVALAPALITAVPLVLPRAARAGAALVCSAVLTVLAVVGGISMGGFFLPTALLSWAAVIVWTRLRGSGFTRAWRFTGAVLTALPVTALLSGALAAGAFSLQPGAWGIITVVLVLAALIALGRRWAGWLLAALGLAIMIVAIASGELLTLMFIWVGGWWLTIGLAHAVATPRRL